MLVVFMDYTLMADWYIDHLLADFIDKNNKSVVKF